MFRRKLLLPRGNNLTCREVPDKAALLQNLTLNCNVPRMPRRLSSTRANRTKQPSESFLKASASKQNKPANEQPCPHPAWSFRNPTLSSQPSRRKATSCLESDFELIKFDQLKVERRLGEGSYAKVELCYDRTRGERVAVKVYQRNVTRQPHRMANVKRQIAVLKRLNHPGVIKLHTAATERSKVYLIMEYGGLTSLNSYWKKQQNRKIPLKTARTIFKNLVSALAYVHSRDVAHRDLKMDNIMLDPDTLETKIIDFGFSLITREDKLTVHCGTPSYMAPELTAKQPYRGKPADVWCLGVILHCMLAGSFPFRAMDERDLFRKIQTCKPAVVEHPTARGLLGKLLGKQPERRPRAGQILEDQFFS